MNTLKSLLLIAVVAVFFTGCEISNICERGEGPTVTKELDLADFHSIELGVSADVFITQGAEQSVTVEGQENIIDLLDLDVRSGTWDIGYDQNCIGRHNGLQIFITIPDVQRLEIHGSGNITSENTIETEDLDLKIQGSGDIDVATKAVTVGTRIEGSGSIKLEGTADDIDVVIRGSGDVKAFDLETLRASVNVSGSGDVELDVADFLEVTINGSGDVYYEGNPQTDIKINGSGDVRGV